MERLATLQSETLVGATLAILFSVNTVFLVVFSVFGVPGNSTFTGLFLIACETAILILSMRSIKLNTMDHLFGAFVLAAAISFAMNGSPAGLKETTIFAVAIACYPVCRFVCATDRAIAAFGLTSLCIAIIGAFATAYAIFQQWPVYEGKPVVFGSDAAGTQFLMALSFFVIAATARKLTRRQAVIISALLLVMSAVFAAALVRFTFVALLLTLALAWFLNAGKQRVYISMMAASIVFGASCGTLIRLDKIPILIGFMMEKTAYRAEAAPPPLHLPASSQTQIPPSCMIEVNMRNSFAERKALWQDSFYLMPRAGLFGFGLDGFIKYSCMKGFPPHNSVFQAIIEFGWLGGISLSAMVAFSFMRLMPTAKFGASGRFAICALAFAVLVSLAHGRLSRDFVLFSVLGFAASVLAASRERKPMMGVLY